MSSAADLIRFEKLFSGTWNHLRNENLEAFLKEKDSEEHLQEFELKMKPTFTVCVEDKSIIWKAKEPSYEFSLKFELGKETTFKDDPDNPTSITKQTAWMEGDELHEKNASVLKSGGKPFTTVVSIEKDGSDTNMVVVTTCGNVSAKRIYKKA